MQLILGLGNPGAEYESTRHNVGFAVLDIMGERLGCSFFQRGRALVTRGEVDGRPFLLAKPTTFMNRSGRAARDLLADLEDEDPVQLLVLCDDFHLPLGQLRCRRQGSSGGQNGLASVLEMVPDGQQVARLRLGVGDPGRKPAEDYVLERFRRSEEEQAADMQIRAADHVIDWLGDGDLDRLVNRANAPLD